jgi:serine-type D-Ala-D-Ala carboxypeptidase/endopeptidase (penicillin-binding protein 4)
MTHARSGLASMVLLTLIAAPVRAQSMKKSIDALLSKLPKRAKVSIVVRRVEGAPLYQRDASLSLRPASNMKLLTLATAIHELGPKFQHETSLYATGAVSGSAIDGDLVVVGRGDPNLSRRFRAADDGSRDVPVLAEWAQVLVRRGVRELRGDVVADDRYFDQERYHPDWEAKEIHKWYAAEISALNLNDNCVDIELVAKPGGAELRLSPPTRYLTQRLFLKPASSAKKHSWGVARGARDNVLTVRGSIWAKATVGRSEVAVHDPALFFVTALKESLERAGIRVTGAPRRVRADESPAQRELVARRVSPLPLTLSVCGKRSLNHYAECLLKTVGKLKAGEGSFAAGLKIMEARLEALGVPVEGLELRDGSGLSRRNRLNARAVASLLSVMRSGVHDQLYRSTLAVGGADGTLRRRFRDLPKGARLEAKTGTLRDASALSGYLFRPGDREPLIFSLIMNDLPGSRRLQDRIIAALLR